MFLKSVHEERCQKPTRRHQLVGWEKQQQRDFRCDSLQPCNVSRVFQYYHVLRTLWWSLEAQQVGMMKRLPLLWLQPISRCVVACLGGLKVQVVLLPALEMILSSFAACLLVISMKRQPNRCWQGGVGLWSGGFLCL